MTSVGSERIALTNGRVFLDGAFVTAQSVVVEGASIAEIVPDRDVRASGARPHDLGGRLLLPGFIDLQVNGGGGVLFNDRPTIDGIRAIAAAHRPFGSTSIMPTLISDELDVVARAVSAVRDAIVAGVPGVIGLHLEGPFLSPERKGAHDVRKLRRLEPEHLDLFSSLDHGQMLVTLAPEMAAPGTIAALVEAGVLVSAGHTNATYDVMKEAFTQGVTKITHLFNAMSPLMSRAPGVLGAALENATAWCGIIVDGRHVDPAALRVALRCRPRDRFVLVTDAMPTVGATEKSFMLQGRRITVRDGVCVDDRGTLSGADLDMASAVRNAMRMLGLPLEDAIHMATTYPAACLRRADLGRIVSGARANFVVCDEDVQVAETWIGGQKVWGSEVPRSSENPSRKP